MLRAICLSGLCATQSISCLYSTNIFIRLCVTYFVLSYYSRVFMETENRTVNLFTPYSFTMYTLVFTESLRKMLFQVFVRVAQLSLRNSNLVQVIAEARLKRLQLTATIVQRALKRDLSGNRGSSYFDFDLLTGVITILLYVVSTGVPLPLTSKIMCSWGPLSISRSGFDLIT
jgi:hypothetical protein